MTHIYIMNGQIRHKYVHIHKKKVPELKKLVKYNIDKLEK
jgi:hypothetical protein